MPDKNRADNSRDRDRSEEMRDKISLNLTSEEGMLLLTSARLLDKLVAGVTIHAQERDQLIKDIIQKLDNKLPVEVSRVASELADAIVDSVLCEGDEEDYILSELGPADDFSSVEDQIAGMLCDPLLENPAFYPHEQNFEGDRYGTLDMQADLSQFDFPMYLIDRTLPVLEAALVKHLSVTAHYYSMARESVDTITLDPLVMLKEGKLWRMVAYCHERQEILIFRVDRIKEIIQTQSMFEAPSDMARLSYARLPVYS